MAVTFISPTSAYEKHKEGAVFIDVREPMETEENNVDLNNVLYIPSSKFALPEGISKDTAIILCCAAGLASEQVANKLVESGYVNVFVVKNGLIDWQKENLPIRYKHTCNCSNCGK